MKKLIFTFLIIHFTFLIANAQWVQQDSLTNQALLDVSFINRNTGWISGRNGIILKTTNAGINWMFQNDGLAGKSMYGIFAVDSNNVYSVGWFETILKTTNGGINWFIIKNGPYGDGHSYESVFFINPNTGWICGSGSKIFKTTNGGVSFDSINISVGYLYDIYFRNSTEGLICGESSAMFRTTNGGNNWYNIIMPVGTEAADYYKLSFVNYNTGYTQGVQNNKLYKTTNFGTNWDSLSRVPGADDSYCIFFPSLLTGWCAGTYGLMFKTTNGGYNWSQVILSNFNTAFIRSLYFYNDSVGWAVGGAGKILYTSNGGMTFINNYNNILSGEFNLSQNYPNPFNNKSKIKYEISENSHIKIKIFDVNGQEMNTIIDKYHSPGEYEITFDGNNLASGIYFYSMIIDGNIVSTKKMLLIK